MDLAVAANELTPTKIEAPPDTTSYTADRPATSPPGRVATTERERSTLASPRLALPSQTKAPRNSAMTPTAGRYRPVPAAAKNGAMRAACLPQNSSSDWLRSIGQISVDVAMHLPDSCMHFLWRRFPLDSLDQRRPENVGQFCLRRRSRNGG